MQIFEEVLDTEQGSIKTEDRFRDYEEWDSLAYLSVIAGIDDEFGLVIPVDEFRDLQTISDIVKYLESHKD
ncbi:MAG: acyl carrier protein [Proteiniphilum sp.]|nr:acyl carrier protein [Proteiniphilum sp.]